MVLSCSYCWAKLEFEKTDECVIAAECGHLFHQACLIRRYKDSRTCSACKNPEQTISLKSSTRILPFVNSNEPAVSSFKINGVRPNAAQNMEIDKINERRNEQVRPRLRTQYTTTVDLQNRRASNATQDDCPCNNKEIYDFETTGGVLVTNWIQCDNRRCNSWYHWKCIGNQNMTPQDKWYCKNTCLDQVKIILIFKISLKHRYFV